MIFIVTYKCKEKHIHEAIFEPSLEDILIYFKEVRNLDLTLDQVKYIDIEKLSNDDTFSNWIHIYGSNKKQKQYDEFYKTNLDKATEELKTMYKYNKSLSDEDINICMEKNFLPDKSLSTLKGRVKKFKGDN